MKALAEFTDIHSHSRRGPVILTNLPLMGVPDTAHGEAWYSVGIHPWETATVIGPDVWGWLERTAADARVAAIGECGLDALRGAPLGDQESLFLRQAKLAGRLEKPLIIHCVRAWHRLLALRKELPDTVPLIIHGFRGKPELARQLLDAGFSLSFGTKYNPATMALCPPQRLYRETDG